MRLTRADWEAVSRFDVFTERLRLRELERSDAHALVALTTPRVARMVSSIPETFTTAAAKAFINKRRWQGVPGFLLAIDGPDGEMIGCIGCGALVEDDTIKGAVVTTPFGRGVVLADVVIDATGDGKRDIWNDWADVAGSVANYFIEHGWQVDGEVVAQATLGNAWKGPLPQPKNKLEARETVAALSDKGVMFATDLPGDSAGELLTYEGDSGLEHWVGFHNFFVITRYNRSAMYALAAHQLGQQIASKVKAHAG